MADNTTKIIISAEDKASAALSSIAGNVTALQGALGGLGATLGATLTVGGFAAFIKSSIDAADAMNDLSQRVGIGVADLAKYELATKQSGTSMESLAKGIKGLAVNMAEHGKALKAAGITATDTDGAMKQLADIFAKMPDGMEKSALAVKVFGKAGMDLIPMLSLGSAGLAEAEEKSKKYAAAMATLAPLADKFNDSLAEIAISSKVAGLTLATSMMPALQGIATAMAMAAQEGGTLKALWIGFGGIADAIVKPFANTVKGLGAEVNTFLATVEEARARITFGSVSEQATKAALAHRQAAAAAWSDLAKQDTRDDPAAPKVEPPKFDREAWIKEYKALMAALGVGGGAGKVDKVKIFGPDVKLFDDDEADKFRKAAKASEDAIEAANKALADHANALAKDVVASERALETYGLTESQIADLTLARLQHAKAMEAEQDADEATLAYYDREIEALQRIRAAKFAIEAKDTAKKEAEAAAKAWQDFARDLESSLTDALMRSFESGDNFGQAFADNLKNLFKTMILKAAVQISVGTVAGAASQVLGINLGGSGGSSGGAGGVLNMLSNGSSIYSAATGGGLLGGFSLGAGSAASELALGASFVGPSASLAGGAIGAGASAGLATGSAGAASAMSSIAAAAPYIAGALAIASIFGGFGKNKPAPIEWGVVDMPLNGTTPEHHGVSSAVTAMGPFSMIGAPGQHLSRNGMSYAQLKAQVANPLAQLDTALAGYMSEAEIKTVGKALIKGNEGEHGWGEKDAVMMRRLNRISDALGGWIDKAFDTTSGNLQKRYEELAQILSVRGNEAVEKLAKDMLNATGKWDYQKFASLQSKVDAFNDSFKTDADRFKDYSDAMHKAFEKMNLVMPDSREAFKKMVEAVDTSTKSGFELYVTLLDLAPTMDAYYQALKDEAAIKGQLAAMNEDHFATAVDYQRYKAVSANFDGQFAGDYAYNIGRGAITPGAAANGDLVSEIRALRAEVQAGNVAIAVNTQETAKTLRRWNGDGMPDVRTVA